MVAIRFAEVLLPEAYERERDAFRQRLRGIKDARRLDMSELITVFFENRETMRYQLQEMIRTERIEDEKALREELEVWNRLIPGPHEVSLTFMIQQQDMKLVRATLRRLKGIEATVFIVVDGEKVAGTPEFRDVSPDMTAAVHYFHYTLSPAQVDAILKGTARVAVRIEHPEAFVEQPLVGAHLEALREDLRESLSELRS